MKTLKNLLLFIMSMSLLIACSKTDSFPDNESPGKTLKKGHSGPVLVTLPFVMKGTGEYISALPDAECGYDPDSNPYMYRIIVDFTGTCTHLGKVTTTFSFCCNIITGDYGPCLVSLVAQNGDSLFITQKGRVMEGRLDDHPDYVTSYWRDPIKIVGGTGRFEGATGSGISDDYNSSLDAYSHHYWKGTITLVKGKR